MSNESKTYRIPDQISDGKRNIHALESYSLKRSILEMIRANAIEIMDYLEKIIKAKSHVTANIRQVYEWCDDDLKTLLLNNPEAKEQIDAILSMLNQFLKQDNVNLTQRLNWIREIRKNFEKLYDIVKQIPSKTSAS